MAEVEPHRKKVNSYIINAIPRPICNVEFKLMPFYISAYEMVRPMAIYFVPTIKPGSKQSQGTDLIKKKQ